MKATTAEWVNKAESDFDNVCILRRSRKHSRLDLICFLCQQCAEKYLKARLSEAGIRFVRTHDLDELLKLALTIEPLWLGMAAQLAALTEYAVVFRYPGKTANPAIARNAFADMKKFRALARSSLGLPA